ncbi:DarT ssDNA thymidine ADP-ribosyltransferase family protein [Sphingobacterium faecium]|uniref:DarT ssDNA thymidine ADP-ribosyltransferase family protein n=1 Tax=Sphingobacterium faecium TaxID=34087 RepID=UPI0032092BB2
MIKFFKEVRFKLIKFICDIIEKWKQKKGLSVGEKNEVANQPLQPIKKIEINDKNKIIKVIGEYNSVTALEQGKEFLERGIEKSKDEKYSKELEDILRLITSRLTRIKSLTSEELEIERILNVQKSIAREEIKFNVYRSLTLEKITSFEDDLISDGFIDHTIISENSAYSEETTDLDQFLKEIGISTESNFLVYEEAYELQNPITEVEVVELFAELNNLTAEDRADKTNLSDVDDIINYLKEQGVKYFYHVTNYENLESIKRQGFFSWDYLDKKGIPYLNEVAGSLSRNLDKEKQLQNYVRFSFCKAMPMFYKKDNRDLQTNIILRISIDCLRECDFKFSNMNATDNLFKLGNSLAFLKNSVKIQIALKNNYFVLEGIDKKYYQAEILIKQHVPAKYIIDYIPF